MLKLFKSKKAQNTAEYAIMIAIVIGVFSAMQLYVRRGLQARIKAGTDNIPAAVAGGSTVLGTDTQYEPYYTREGTQDMSQVTSEGNERGTVAASGGIRDLEGATSSRNGYQTMTGTDAAD
jgi:hypothetical protein